MSANNNNGNGGNNNGNGNGGGSFIEVTLPPPKSDDLPAQFDWDSLTSIPTPKP